MKKQNRKNKNIGFNIVEVITIIIVSSVLSIVATGIITTNNNSTNSGTSYSELLQDSNIKNFLDTYANVMENYYGDIDKEKVIDSAISGMMDYLGDKYSTYLDGDDTDALNDKLLGTYKGIGVSVTQDKVINDVFDDSPAQKVGIKDGDIIIEVNGIDVKEKTSTDVINILNENPDNIKIKVLRNEEELEFELKMEDVPKQVVAYTSIDTDGKKVGYMYIETFSSVVSKQVNNAINKLEQDNIDGLIIDLRRNTGGYLTAAQDTASLFLEKGKPIYSLESKNDKKTYYDETDEHRTYPIVVIVDEVSASASEILTGALKDSYGAKVVGLTTYGKGLVQQTQKLNDGTMVKYSTAKWLRPNGECVEGIGIIPDYEINKDTEVEKKITDNLFIDKAIEVLFK